MSMPPPASPASPTMTDEPEPEQPQSLLRSSTMPAVPGHRSRHSIGVFESATIPQTSQETLYTHPSVRIVKFSVPPSSAVASTSPSVSDLDYPVDAIETLPWKVPTERVVARGRMSVDLKFATPFLKAGVVSQVLVKNSQAWCVDGMQSVFVVRTGKLAYLRIEMPYDTHEDRDLVEGFKQALSGIIRYEVTPCPFKRGFSVEIPEEAKTPRKKKAWKPKHTPLTRLERWEFGARHTSAGDDRDTASDFGSVLGEESDDTSSQTSGLHVRSPSRPSTADYQSSSPIPIPRRPASRAVSEPARSFESLLAKFQVPAEPPSEVDDASPTSSVDSFYSFQDTVSGSLFSPPYLTPAPSIHASYSADDLHIPSFPRHQRELSEVTIRETTTADATTATRIGRSPLGHDTPPTPSSLPASTGPEPEPQPERDPASARRGHPSETLEIEEPRFAEPRRRRPFGRRDLSPLPPPSALFVPSRTSDRSLATALIRRTCSLVFETPVQLLFMLLRLAANIATKREHSRKQSQAEESDGPAIPLSTLPSHDSGSNDTRQQQQPPGGWSELD